jgi:hypothetical protein
MTVEERLAQLTARVDALERQQWVGPPRLGPKPPTDDEVRAAVDRLAQTVAPSLTSSASERTGEVPPVDRSKVCTTNGKPVGEVLASQTNETGQHDGYIVLCDEERAKGFVRPYRDAYKHVGPVGPRFQLRDLTSDEHAKYDRYGYVKYEPYPESESPVMGRFWTQTDLEAVGRGCGAVTTMGRSLSETYARDPGFYGATFCATCNRHFPVGEFVWTADGAKVGS